MTLDLTIDTRPGAMFRRTIRDNLTGIFGWGLGYGMLLALVTLLYPSLAEAGALVGVLDGLGLLEAVTASRAADVAALGTFPGYLALEALALAPAILAVYLIPQTLNAVMGEEDRGTLDVLLSMPVPRWRLIVEKLAAILLSLALILLLMFVALVIATRLVPEAELTIGQAAAGIWHIFPISCCVIGVTLLLSVTLRSSRTVGGLAALFVLGGFFVRSLADATGTPAMQTIRRFSLYDYYSAIDAMVNRVPWETDIALLGLALVLYAASVWQFGRRDVGV